MNTVIEILIDYSQSMGISVDEKTGRNSFALSDGSTKMSVVKKILINEIIPTIDYAEFLNIRTFSHNDSTSNIQLIYGDKYDKELIIKKIEEIDDPTSGKTPITDAIEKASESLLNFPDSDKKIFLLTDGQENTGKDYKAAVKKIIEIDKIPCQVFIIGINQNQEAEVTAKEIANITGGIYIHLKQKKYSSEYIKSKLSPIKASAITGSLNALTITQTQKSHKTDPTGANQNNTIKDDKTDNTQSVIVLDNTKEETSQSTDENVKNSEVEIETPLSEYATALNLINKQLQILSNEIESIKADKTIISESFDEDQELNEKIRIASEQYVFEMLKKNYPERVHWLNEAKEAYKEYDFKILNPDDTVEYFIECKASKNTDKVFLMTGKEWSHFIGNTINYQIYFVSEALTQPKVIKIDNLLDWILKGYVLPYSSKNISLKPERIFLRITKH